MAITGAGNAKYDSDQDNLQKRLISYTSPIYEAGLRQNALEQLLLNQILIDEVLQKSSKCNYTSCLAVF
jgi:hypothetical protein